MVDATGQLDPAAGSSSVSEVPTEPQLSVERAARHAAEQAAAAHAARLQALAEASAVLARAGFDDHAIVDHLCDLATIHVGDACAVRMVSEDRQSLSWAAVRARDPQMQAFVQELLMSGGPAEVGLSGGVLGGGGALLIPVMTPGHAEKQMQGRVGEFAKRYPIRSMIAVPLRSGGQTIGVLSMNRFSPENPYTEADLVFCQELADRTALAVANARLFHAERRALARAELALARTAVLQHLTASLSMAVSQAEVGKVLAEQGTKAVGAQAGMILLLTPDGSALEMLTTHGVAGQDLSRWQRHELADAPVFADVLRSRTPRFFDDYREWIVSAPTMSQTGLLPPGGRYVLPLLVGEQVLGIAGFALDGSRTLADDEQQLLMSIAEQGSLALHRAWLYEAAEQARRQAVDAQDRMRAAEERAVRLQALAADLSASLTPVQVADVVLEHVRAAIGAEAACIGLQDEEAGLLQPVRAFAHATGPISEVAAMPLDGPAPMTAAARQGLPLYVAEAFPDLHGGSGNPAITAESATAVFLPLFVEARCLGTLALRVPAGVGADGSLDHRYLAIVVSLCAQALERARLYDESRQAVQVRDDFLSVASHELRTPLTTLQLQQDMLMRASRSDPAMIPYQPRLEQVNRQVQRLTRLIHDLLDVTRLSAGRIVLEPEDMDLAELVQEVAGRFEIDLARSGTTLTMEGASAPGCWDRFRLDQVVTNLLANAIKYGNGQPITLAVAPAGEQVVFTVRDQGIGIDAGMQERLFQRFERLVSSQHYGGFGLGLWITRQIVDAMGGTVGVVSGAGDGATFTVVLPRR